MNQFALNGATLNGLDGIPLTAGNVNLLASSRVLANPTLVQAASANTSAAASISVGVNAIARVIAGASAQVQAASQITLAPTHSQAASASLFASASFKLCTAQCERGCQCASASAGNGHSGFDAGACGSASASKRDCASESHPACQRSLVSQC